MIVQSFNNDNEYKKQAFQELIHRKPEFDYDIFGDEVIDNFFQYNKFVPTHYLTYTVFDINTGKITQMCERGKCYIRVFQNPNGIYKDTIIAVYKHKLCIVGKELATHIFTTPINFTHDSLMEHSENDNDCEYKVLYEFIAKCVDSYIDYEVNEEIQLELEELKTDD